MTRTAIILAAGQGRRMKSDIPKPMFKVLGEPMLEWVIKACKGCDISNLRIVTGYQSEYIDEYLSNRYRTVLQAEQKGTAHAIMQCREFLEENIDGHTLILYGGNPLIDSDTIQSAFNEHIENDNALTIVTFMSDKSLGYGRVIRENQTINRCVEDKNATPDELKVNEINTGVSWFKTSVLLEALDNLLNSRKDDNYNLNETISILVKENERVGGYITENENVILAASDRKALLKLNEAARLAVIDKHLENGVDFISIDGIIIETDVKIGSGTKILPGTILEGYTTIGEGCTVGPNCLINNSFVGDNTNLNYVQAYESRIGTNVKMGPFVHIRPNSVIRNGVKIGDFVEIKNSVIGEDTAVAHLTYVGDSDVGRRVNFGCGCVTVNYDGVKKSRTVIGDNAFIGCNTNMIAPVKIGNGAYTAAGTTVTRDIPDNALAIDRGDFRIKEGYAARKLGAKNKS